MRRIHTQVSNMYTMQPEHSECLSSQIDAIEREGGPFPVVFQHGDCGTWNLLVTNDDGIALLDWEVSDRAGVPLWDLLYFVQTHTQFAGGLRRSRDPVRNFDEELLQRPDLAGRVAGAIEHYCHAVGVSGALREPLFYTWLMFQSRKEAILLDPAEIDNGAYIRLLRACIERRNSPTFRRLFFGT